jgi:hypothetical protein
MQRSRGRGGTQRRSVPKYYTSTKSCNKFSINGGTEGAPCGRRPLLKIVSQNFHSKLGTETH